MSKKRKVTNHYNPKWRPIARYIMCYICGKFKNSPLVKVGDNYRHDDCIPRR